jgi:nucleoside-diphosphate-sugar epimerase
MKIAITGAAGLVGRKLVERLSRDGSLNGRDITDMLLIDVIEPSAPAGVTFAVETQAVDISAPGAYERLSALKPDVIFHLAAIVSGEAETDFDKGYRINLDGTRGLYEAVRQAGFNPRLVFTSSIAVFGAPFPEAIGDEFLNAPLTSYGAQKAMGELMLSDYTRKGMLDGIGIRLPTIVVRPGKPNKAASGFFSGIIREPLMGHRAVCPVSRDVMHWMASPRSAVNFLIHAAGLDGDKVGPRRNLTMPGIAVTVGEMVESLERVAGADPVKLIDWQPDPFIVRIVDGWPRKFDATRAAELGFTSETDMDQIIRVFIDDELAAHNL